MECSALYGTSVFHFLLTSLKGPWGRGGRGIIKARGDCSKAGVSGHDRAVASMKEDSGYQPLTSTHMGTCMHMSMKTYHSHTAHTQMYKTGGSGMLNTYACKNRK